MFYGKEIKHESKSDSLSWKGFCMALSPFYQGSSYWTCDTLEKYASDMWVIVDKIITEWQQNTYQRNGLSNSLFQFYVTSSRIEFTYLTPISAWVPVLKTYMCILWGTKFEIIGTHKKNDLDWSHKYWNQVCNCIWMDTHLP